MAANISGFLWRTLNASGDLWSLVGRDCSERVLFRCQDYSNYLFKMKRAFPGGDQDSPLGHVCVFHFPTNPPSSHQVTRLYPLYPAAEPFGFGRAARRVCESHFRRNLPEGPSREAKTLLQLYPELKSIQVLNNSPGLSLGIVRTLNNLVFNERQTIVRESYAMLSYFIRNCNDTPPKGSPIDQFDFEAERRVLSVYEEEDTFADHDRKPKNNELAIFRFLVDDCGANFHDPNIIQQAVSCGRCDIVRFLLDRGCDPAEGFVTQISPKVSIDGCGKLIDLLVEYGCGLETKIDGHTPLERAAAFDNLTWVKALVDKGAIFIREKGLDALHITTFPHSRIEIADFFLRQPHVPDLRKIQVSEMMGVAWYFEKSVSGFAEVRRYWLESLQQREAFMLRRGPYQSQHPYLRDVTLFTSEAEVNHLTTFGRSALRPQVILLVESIFGNEYFPEELGLYFLREIVKDVTVTSTQVVLEHMLYFSVSFSDTALYSLLSLVTDSCLIRHRYLPDDVEIPTVSKAIKLCRQLCSAPQARVQSITCYVFCLMSKLNKDQDPVSKTEAIVDPEELADLMLACTLYLKRGSNKYTNDGTDKFFYRLFEVLLLRRKAFMGLPGFCDGPSAFRNICDKSLPLKDLAMQSACCRMDVPQKSKY